MSRITMNDTGRDIVIKMADGNPGAIGALMGIVEGRDQIDPSASRGVGAIMMFDTWEIYGSAIYVLWSDKCGRDTRKLLILMRATQLGFLPVTRLQEMAADQMRQVELTETEWADLDKKVCGRLPQFVKPE